MTSMEARATQADPIRAAAYQAFWLLRIGFTAAPILFGIDKFFNWTVHWPDYLAGWINKRAMHERAGQLLSQVGVALSPARRMRELRVAEMQAVEIARALAHQADIVIMDGTQEHVYKQGENLHSDCDYSNWDAWKVTGFPVTTILRGHVMIDQGAWVVLFLVGHRKTSKRLSGNRGWQKSRFVR